MASESGIVFKLPLKLSALKSVLAGSRADIIPLTLSMSYTRPKLERIVKTLEAMEPGTLVDVDLLEGIAKE